MWTWTIAATPPAAQASLSAEVAGPAGVAPTLRRRPPMRGLAAALSGDVNNTARALRRTGRAALVRRRGVTVRGLDAAWPDALADLSPWPRGLGRGRRTTTRSGRHAVRLRLTRAGLRALARDGHHRLTLHIAFRDATGRIVRRSTRLRLRG